LEKLNKDLESNYKIKYYECPSGYKKEDNNPFIEARLYICNKYFAKNLYENFGMIPNRENIDLLVNKIPEKLLNHFIRGVIDADGSFGFTYANDSRCKNPTLKFRIGITTNYQIIDLIQDYLFENNLLNSKQKILKRHIEEERDLYCRDIHICAIIKFSIF
jgi:hypothetical protein